MPRVIVVLAGGMGAARFLRGLAAVVPREQITVIGNTGDDIDVYGVHVSPDLDIVTFMLGGVLDEAQQFGLTGDTHVLMDELAAAGHDVWFRLGDRDHALCLARTMWLRDGETLSVATARIGRRFGLRTPVIPMTDDPAPTFIETAEGRMHFQEYWVRWRAQVEARAIDLSAARAARPAPGVLEAIARADAVLLAPSNPVVSLGPILAVPGIREALADPRVPVIGVSPIVGGRVVRGMADRLLPVIGCEVSARGVAGLYADLLDGFVIDHADTEQAADIACRVEVTQTLMHAPEDAMALAKVALDMIG